MSRLHVLAVAAIAVMLGVVPFAAAAGGGNKGTDAIWINLPGASPTSSSPTLTYGQSFSAGFTSKTAYPWAHAQCRDSTGVAFWGEWRALQADGTIGVFDLTTVNSGIAWPSGGAGCTLDLVNTQKYTVLATTTFFVAAS